VVVLEKLADNFMQWSDYISATTTLSESSVWFLAMFEEFKIYLYIGAGIALAFGMIIFLSRVFYFNVKKGFLNDTTHAGFSRETGLRLWREMRTEEKKWR